MVGEEDTAKYTIKAVDDPRTLNKIMYLRPPSCVITHNEMIDLWEKKTGKKLERIYISEQDAIKKIEGKARSEPPLIKNLCMCFFSHQGYYPLSITLLHFFGYILTSSSIVSSVTCCRRAS